MRYTIHILNWNVKGGIAVERDAETPTAAILAEAQHLEIQPLAVTALTPERATLDGVSTRGDSRTRYTLDARKAY